MQKRQKNRITVGQKVKGWVKDTFETTSAAIKAKVAEIKEAADVKKITE